VGNVLKIEWLTRLEATQRMSSSPKQLDLGQELKFQFAKDAKIHMEGTHFLTAQRLIATFTDGQ
jgi:hypothetical protein